MKTAGRVWTRAALMRRGGALAGLAAAGAALAACGTAQGGAATAPQKPSAPVEVEFWQVAAGNNPTEAGRIKALQAAEQANADYFKIKFAETGGANMTKVVAAVAAGTPPNLRIDYP